MKSKYEKGRKITNVGDFEKSPAEFFRVRFGNHERTIHRGFIESWQYHMLYSFIRAGLIYKAKLIDQKDGNENE